MTNPAPGSFAAVLGALGTGLPILLLHLGVALALLAAGVAAYMAITPFHEPRLMRTGNFAAATVLAGSVVALAVPLAVLVATTVATLDLVVWGVVAIIIQLLTFLIVSRLIGRLKPMVEAGQVAGAIPLAAAQLAVALLNAAAMVPT